jgi:hypothetical protein
VALRGLGIGRGRVSSNFAEEAEGIGLVAAFSALSGKLQSSFRGRKRILNLVSEQACFAQLDADK